MTKKNRLTWKYLPQENAVKNMYIHLFLSFPIKTPLMVHYMII